MSRLQFALLSALSIIAICLALRRKSWICSVHLPVPASLALLASIYIFYDLFWKRRLLPPGPTPWLIFGNIFHCVFHNKSIDDIFLAWKQKYGNVFTFWIGPIPLVMVSDVETMREYFVHNAEAFSNRWRNHATDSFMGGEYGVIQIDGDKWREQRRFALRVLRDFGVGRALIEQRILTEVDILMDHLEAMCGDNKEVDLCAMQAVCVGNIINSILFGYRFQQGSEEFHFLHSLLDSQSQLVMHPLMGLYVTLPLATCIPLLNYKWNQFMDLRSQLWKFISKQVQDHVNIYNNEELPEVSDFTYVYLEEISRRKTLGEPSGYFSEWQLTMLLLDLFFAGMETTVTTLKWGFLLSIIHPDIQDKVQCELDQVGERITLADKSRCPFTMATIFEIQRFANILTVNLLRTVAEDTKIGKYFYPAGTLCIPQISIAMNDPINFPEPKKFYPQRFLENDGLTLKRNDAFLPFSIGKRQCLGESLAKAELFLIYANLLRHYRFRTLPNRPNPSTERLTGLTTSPPPYKCIVEKRLSSDCFV